ncbi:MAG TPA: glycosyl hydrolase 53 family protein [Opitutaceae bacterium]|nr:glycosyl hydrolase 53 family protein [Opitutaceae bacterium]
MKPTPLAGFRAKFFFAVLVPLLSAFASFASAADFAKGADVGWLTQMEASGIKFYNSSGTQQDCLQILQGLGMNTIRLRVWVNPAGGWNGQTDVVNKAVRAKNRGLRVMIDFHYSDSWADPGQQTKPAAWSSHAIAQLRTDVANHTTAVLNALKSAGVTPEWVQVGNETNNGMLWNDGRASTSMANFASLITSGYNAVKAVFPSAKVIVHISNGYDNALFRWIFDGLQANGAGSKYDVIGMSLYPTTSNWSTLTSQCLTNMNDMVSRYGKDVMVVEVGMDVSAASTSKSFLTDIIAKTKSVSGGRGLGVLYWEPQAYNSWQGYNLGAFGSNGRPTIALDAFANTSSNAFPAAGTYSLRNRTNGLMLDNLGATGDGANVGSWADGTSNNQRWVLSYISSNVVKLQCVSGSKCLDGLGRTTNGSLVGQWASGTSNNQRWTIIDAGGGYFKLKNVGTGLCLDVGASPYANGDSVEQWSDGSSQNQHWQFVTP